MTDHPSDEVIAANAERVARVLGRRLSPKRLDGLARDEVMASVLRARQTGDIGALHAALDATANGIESARRRAYSMCRLLLEAAWAVPLDSPLEACLADRIRGQFRRCRADDAELFASLREEFISFQRSSLPVVRRLVGDALVDEPAEPADLAVLADERQPHDVRGRICARILWANQGAELVALFEYFLLAIRDRERRQDGQAAEAAASVELITRLLKSRRSEDVLRHLLPPFVKNHRDPVVSGPLMKLLREYGDPLVSALVDLYRGTDQSHERSAFSRLLGHIAQHNRNPLAVEAMAGLLLDARGGGTDELADAFLKAARGTFAGDGTFESQPARRAFLEAMSQFEQTSDPVLRVLADNMRRLPQDGVRPEMVERYLRGELNQDQAYQIRYCGMEGMRVLVDAARSRERPTRERRLAVETLGGLRNPRLRDQVPEVILAVYRDDPDNAVRAAALEVVVGHAIRLTEADRQLLLQDDGTATGALRKVIDGNREALFPAGVLDLNRPPEARPS